MRSTARLAAGCSVSVLLAVAATASGDLRLVEAVKNRDAARAQALLTERVDPNVRQPDGATALHWAAHWDDVATVELLLHAGAEVDTANDYGVTPLAVACRNGSTASAKIVETLLQAGANPDAELPSGETVLMTASFAGRVDAVQSLLARGADVNATETIKGQTALMWAVSEGHREVARALLDHGADVNAPSTGQSTPLLLAARGGDIELARMLLAAGADVSAQGADGSTPLLIATFRRRVDLAKALLDGGRRSECRRPWIHGAALGGWQERIEWDSAVCASRHRVGRRDWDSAREGPAGLDAGAAGARRRSQRPLGATWRRIGSLCEIRSLLQQPGDAVLARGPGRRCRRDAPADRARRRSPASIRRMERRR